MQTKDMFSLAAQYGLPVVMLIDDDLVSREVTATLLTMSGYDVHTAESGELAVKMLADAEFAPGVILMDAQMPGLNGKDLIAQLRAYSGAKIYAISGSELPREIAEAADGFLLKPFTVDSIKKLTARQNAEPAAPRIDPDEPVLSSEVLAQFRKLMPEPAVRQIYSAVVEDLDKRIEALDAAIAQGDTAEVRRIGHAIKGGCGMAGAVQVAHLGAMLEAWTQGPKDNQLDNSAALLHDLRLAARGLERMLNAELPA
jgi:CheY-like chemotaxis protein/HPt (histidine-containing phosphotransfer) domain-containing protein